MRSYLVAVSRSARIPNMIVPGEKPALYLGSGARGVRLVASKSSADKFETYAAAEFAAGLCVGGYVVAESA